MVILKSIVMRVKKVVASERQATTTAGLCRRVLSLHFFSYLLCSHNFPMSSRLARALCP